MHITFLENKPNVAVKGPTWLFDLDYLTDSMNYQPVILKKKLNLLRTTLYCQYGLLILQQSRGQQQRMLDLGLEVEEESIVALDLIRFIKQ
ncbi:hypothetical protein Tco_0430202 [Tanacetum coccineum]